MGISYQLTNDPNRVHMLIEGEERTLVIPNDPLNKEWQDYQEWLALGNKPLPVPPPLKSSSAAPTVESLMSELEILKAKIEALK
jgi:hypothetical protein